MKLSSGARLELYERLDSTNLEVKRRTEAGERGPLWVLAQSQTAGYGRRGREWEQAVGDFAGTLLVRPEGDPTRFGELSFVAAIAVHEAISVLARSGIVQAKWPNDILIEEAKVSGLLLEFIDVKPAPLIALGIGINIVSKPENTPYPTTRLIDHGVAAPPSPQDIAGLIDKAFWRAYTTWRDKGFPQVQEQWLSIARGVGEKIVVRLPDEERTGIFEGIDKAGALILRMKDETQTINVGEVYFG